MFLSESTYNSFYNESITVEPTEAGMLNILREEQAELFNITVAMVKLEHTAIITENQALLEGGVADFFARIWEMIKRAFVSIVRWFQNLFQKIKEWWYNIDKFLKNNKAALLKFSGSFSESIYGPMSLKGVKGFYDFYQAIAVKEPDAKSMIAAAKAGGEISEVVQKVGSKIKNFDPKQDIEKQVRSMLSDMVKNANESDSWGNLLKRLLFNGNAEPVSQNVDGAMIAEYVKNLEYAKEFGDTLKKIEGDVKGVFNVLEAAAKEGKSMAERHDADAQVIKSYKDAIGFLNKARMYSLAAIAGVSSARATNISEAMRICKKALKEDKKSSKQEKQSASYDFLNNFGSW